MFKKKHHKVNTIVELNAWQKENNSRQKENTENVIQKIKKKHPKSNKFVKQILRQVLSLNA